MRGRRKCFKEDAELLGLERVQPGVPSHSPTLSQLALVSQLQNRDHYTRIAWPRESRKRNT
ncbi:hypothetical protein GQ43DRAFT_458609 [Delitschia confertaspora ATCC 74209]|uniref:Uncharacterized protein n=1 Tax=Delitschia confertaspora ATCC 74209 TaxID=1513339 RepID=A0A9P4JFD7_9PLEO|nr:hypothetical protein GQ43DRAFT_458609 [Delitschia confertaspora ATCC 74209]